MKNTEIARAMMKTQSTEKLLEAWDITETADYTEELPIVRGWIMDALKERDAEAYEAWQDVDPFENPELDNPRCWFKTAA